MTRNRGEKPTEKQQHNQGMETAEIVRHSVLPVYFDKILGKFPIKFYLERQNSLRSEMYFKILSDRARHHRKHDETESQDRKRTSVESHMSEKDIHYRDKDGYLRKSRSDQCPAQLIHPPENLQRKLLDASEHKTRRKNQSEWQSPNQIRIRSIYR
jgi:hypothetical protein